MPLRVIPRSEEAVACHSEERSDEEPGVATAARSLALLGMTEKGSDDMKGLGMTRKGSDDMKGLGMTRKGSDDSGVGRPRIVKRESK